MDNYLLEMKNINMVFPGVKALSNVNFNLLPGEVHVLLGENGAGKSTLIKVLSGAYRRTSGEIYINGDKAEINEPKDAFKYSISVIYQEFNLNPYMSIYENLFLGREYTNSFGLIDRNTAIMKSQKALSEVGLNISPVTLVKNLSVAQKQMVEISKAMIMDVKILVLDEPTATLTESEIEKLFSIIRDLKKKGVGIIYISHRMKELKEIGDRCTVMRDGCYIDTVELKDTTGDDLISMMVGRKVTFQKKSETFKTRESVLEVNNLCYKGILSDISFDLKKGELLGVSGLVGSGRTELAKCIIGEYKKTRGSIVLNEKEISNESPSDAVKNGIVYLSEDRKNEGLILKHDIKENVCISCFDKLKARLLLSKRKQNVCTDDMISKLSIKTPSRKVCTQNLSGGNQQKVVIAKWLLADAQVYIFDEPTRGIDVGAREEIYKIMLKLLENGASIIMISSDLVEILKMSDRIMVICRGKVAGFLDNEKEVRQEDILKYAIGGGC